MLRIQKRLDVIIAVTSEDLENRKEGFSDSLAQKKEDFTASITTRVEDLKSGIEEKLESIRTSAQKSPNQYLESVKNEVAGRSTPEAWQTERMSAAYEISSSVT